MTSTNVNSNTHNSEVQSKVFIDTSNRNSKVWREFDLIESQSPSKKPKASCQHYGKSYDGSSTAGTSHLNYHLLVCKKRPKVENKSGNVKVDKELLS
ncbi:hypothetical protein REPUB_Repub18cG0048700 [Reevesia pubescens]